MTATPGCDETIEETPTSPLDYVVLNAASAVAFAGVAVTAIAVVIVHRRRCLATAAQSGSSHQHPRPARAPATVSGSTMRAGRRLVTALTAAITPVSA